MWKFHGFFSFNKMSLNLNPLELDFESFGYFLVFLAFLAFLNVTKHKSQEFVFCFLIHHQAGAN